MMPSLAVSADLTRGLSADAVSGADVVVQAAAETASGYNVDAAGQR